MINIQQNILTDDFKKLIFDGFSEHAINTIGFDGAARDQIAFAATQDNEVIGAITVLPFYGALWINHFYIIEKYRNQGIVHRLIDSAMNFGREQNLDFVFVETLSFQALEFYQKLGFELEFTRGVFQKGVSFHYLQKKL